MKIAPVLIFIAASLGACGPRAQAVKRPQARAEASHWRRIPFVPQTPHVEVVRCVIHADGLPQLAVIMDGLEAVRQRREGENIFIDAKLTAPGPATLADAVRRFDAAIRRLAPGAEIKTTVLVAAMTRSAYQARYGGGWPD